TLSPDVILLDIEMPKMTGVEFLQKRKELKLDVPVIVLSSIATEGAAVTIKCLELGASDFITKPGGSSISLNIADVSGDIIECISSYGGAYALMHGKNVYDPEFFLHQKKLKEATRRITKQKGDEAVKSITLSKADIASLSAWTPAVEKKPSVVVPEREGGRIEIIAIGISTGGPNALREMFKSLDSTIHQPIVVVQHMPAGFTAEFAASLNAICPLTVTEARDGEPLLGGHVYIAPGNYHMQIVRKPIGNIIRLNQDAQRNGHRPSADVLFESIAQIYGNKALGIIMTGMGRDGAAQLAEMRKKGAWTLGQNQASCIVYGMPKVAYELGAVQKQVALNDMAGEINKLAAEHLYR
nr:chemotaxis-specific protein-glutamate methyltransferase CheB [Treponema sp.]